MMIMATLPAYCNETADAAGDGTFENPYNGTLTLNLDSWPDVIFIEVGTALDCYGGDAAGGTSDTIAYGDDFGLDLNSVYKENITGVVNKIGITYTTSGYGGNSGYGIGDIVIFVPEGFNPSGPDYLYGYYSNSAYQPVTNWDTRDESTVYSAFYLVSEQWNFGGTGDFLMYPGSPVFIDGMSLVSAGDNSIERNEDGYIVGVLDGTEPLVLEILNPDIISPRYLTFTPYSPFENLDFESDPVEDGILVPPNHHLVTFIYEDGTTVYRVVEHGGRIEDVPPASENRAWHSSLTGFATVSLIIIESDITFDEISNHTGGGSQIG